MIKWFVYIGLVLLLAPVLSSGHSGEGVLHKLIVPDSANLASDTVKKKKVKSGDSSEPKKIKEVAKAKNQPRPEKVDKSGYTEEDKKTKRQRRPPGLQRPPEIPRRNGP